LLLLFLSFSFCAEPPISDTACFSQPNASDVPDAEMPDFQYNPPLSAQNLPGFFPPRRAVLAHLGSGQMSADVRRLHLPRWKRKHAPF
jgi:hypothetical protein